MVKNSEKLLEFFEKVEPEVFKELLPTSVYEEIIKYMSENLSLSTTIFPISVDAKWKDNDDEKQ